MIIHINPTLQSYLVHEENMIIFLKHAGITDGIIMSRDCIEQFSRRQGWLQQWHWFESCPPCFICSIQKSIVKTRIQLIVYMYFNKVHCKNDELLELISFFRDQARLNRQQKAYKI